jgi:hypothetical protein
MHVAKLIEEYLPGIQTRHVDGLVAAALSE